MSHLLALAFDDAARIANLAMNGLTLALAGALAWAVRKMFALLAALEDENARLRAIREEREP